MQLSAALRLTLHFSRRRKRASAGFRRVCQAWHRASEVKVLAPGDRGAEG